jgi:hypothetical protein
MLVFCLIIMLFSMALGVLSVSIYLKFDDYLFLAIAGVTGLSFFNALLGICAVSKTK